MFVFNYNRMANATAGDLRFSGYYNDSKRKPTATSLFFTRFVLNIYSQISHTLYHCLLLYLSFSHTPFHADFPAHLSGPRRRLCRTVLIVTVILTSGRVNINSR